MPRTSARKTRASRKLFCLLLIAFNVVAMGSALYGFNTLGQLSIDLALQKSLNEQAFERITILERVLRVAGSEPGRGRMTPRSFEVIATAYTPDDGGGNGIAADGRPVVPYRSIAVDPRVIAPGSKVYVPGFGIMDPHDTGGAIIGNRIDICLPTKEEAYTWGVRKLRVMVVNE